MSCQILSSSKGRGSTILLGKLFKCLTTHPIKGLFLYLKGIFCISHCAYCLLSCRWAPLKIGWARFPRFFPTGVCVRLWGLCWAFSRLNNLSSLSISSYEKCPNSLFKLVAICWTPSSSSLLLIMWGAQTLTPKYRHVSPRQRREEGSSLLISRWCFSKWSLGCWWPLLQGHISGFWSACCSKRHQGHFAKPLPSKLGPSMYLCMGLLYYKTFFRRIKDTGGFVKGNAY